MNRFGVFMEDPLTLVSISLRGLPLCTMVAKINYVKMQHMYVNMQFMLLVNIIKLLVVIDKLHDNIIILHFDIIYLACRGQKPATKLYKY